MHWADCQRIYSNLQHLESGIRFVFDYNCVTLLDQWLSRLCISTDQPKLFIIVIWFCWTIYTFLCLISFCASVHQANGTLPQWVVEHTCNVSSYRFVFPWILLSVHIWAPYYGEFILMLLWSIMWMNCLILRCMMKFAATLYLAHDELSACRQNEASAVCQHVFIKWESLVQECGKCFKYTLLCELQVWGIEIKSWKQKYQ